MHSYSYMYCAPSRDGVLPSSVGSESAPHFNIGPCGRGFELSWRRKKKVIGTFHNSICEWETTKWVGPVGGALTIKGAFYCGTLASAADPTYSDFWWTPGLGRPPYPLRDLPHFHGSPRTWDLGLKHQILTNLEPGTHFVRIWCLSPRSQVRGEPWKWGRSRRG